MPASPVPERCSVIVVTDPGVEELLADARARIRRYTPAEAAAAMHEGAVLVDLRSQDDREAEGIVPRSIHVPLSVLQWRVDPRSGWSNPLVADRALELVLICSDGCSSSLAAASLVEMGFERSGDVVGGFRAWAADGLPLARPREPRGGLPGMGGPEA